jgi:hypothetical protein
VWTVRVSALRVFISPVIGDVVEKVVCQSCKPAVDFVECRRYRNKGK